MGRRRNFIRIDSTEDRHQIGIYASELRPGRPTSVRSPVLLRKFYIVSQGVPRTGNRATAKQPIAPFKAADATLLQ